MLRRDMVERAAGRMDALIADLTARGARQNFNLDFWSNLNERPRECGFAGCLVGWAAYQRWFEGESVSVTLDEQGFPLFFGTEDPDDVVGGVCALFGIERRAARCLIYPEHYDGRASMEKVRDRLRALLVMDEDEFLQTYFGGERT